MNKHLFKDDIQVASKHMKICSTSLVIKKMKIKTTLRTPPDWLKYKRQTITSIDKNVEKLNHSYIASGVVNGAATVENHLAVSPSVMTVSHYQSEVVNL